MKHKYKLRMKTFAIIGGIITSLIFIALFVLYFTSVQYIIPDYFTHSDNSIPTTDNANKEKYLKIQSITKPLKTAIVDNFGIDYDVPPAAQAKGTVRIPVLTFHHTANLPNDMKTRDYYVSPKIMDEQIAYLANKGYRSITPQEFYDFVMKGVNPKQKVVMITFDDGGLDNYTNAFPILKKYGMIGVFYVPSNKHGITNAQLKEMSDAGMVIDPHGKTHMLLSKVTDAGSLYSEIGESKINIENLTNKKVVSFCYPGCEYNGTVIATLKANGYKLAFSCGKSIDHKASGMFVLSRMHVYNDMNHFKSILSGVSYYPSYSN